MDHRHPRQFQVYAKHLAVLVAALVFRFLPYSYNLPHEYAVCSASKHIYTVDELNPRVECIVVRGSRVLDTGTYQEVQMRTAAHLGPIFTLLRKVTGLGELKVYHVKPNSIVVPGLADAHGHILDYGRQRQLDLHGATSIEDVVDRVKRYINAHPDVLNDSSCWIEGMGWDQTRWKSIAFPTAADLDTDPLLQGRPIALVRVDGHASWVSPRVLELMGPIPPTVEGGTIMRDTYGNPSGVFIDNAMSLIPRPPWSERQMEDYFHITMKDALAHGLTSIHDAESSPGMIDLYKRIAEEGGLPIRLYLMGHVQSYSYGDWINKFPRLVDYGKHSRLNVRSVKLYTDGALGSWGAALLEPYSDNPETSGILLSTPEKLTKLVERLWHDGWQINIHCIGDHANKIVLDIFEDMAHRPCDIHGEKIMTKEDLARTGNLGVITSVQPTHATSDMWYAELRLGANRIKGAYAYQTLLQASPNHVLPLGSDFPVEGINPLLGFYAAVTRLSTVGTSPHGGRGWFPEERLTRVQALKGMTLDAAYASFAEADLGSLVPGKKADFVVLDRDIMSVPIDDIIGTGVQATVVDGRVAYGQM